MKEFGVTLLGGPGLMALTMLSGIGLGYTVGFIPACIFVGGVAIYLGIQLAKRTSGTTGMLAVVFAALTGAAGAMGFHRVRQLETRDFARNVPLADVQRFRTRDRLTLRDGNDRNDLDGYAASVTKSGGASDRRWTSYQCEAYPIVPAGWTPSAPVTVWRLGESADFGRHHEVYQPTTPSDICRTAIDKATSAHDLTTANDAVYLMAKSAESDDVTINELTGPLALALMGGMWIVVVLFQGLGAVLASRKARA